MREVPIGELVGKTFEKVFYSDVTGKLTFEGLETFSMHHEQDCCEDVHLSDVCGDLADLVGSPILAASVSSSNADDKTLESGTWTFYNIATIKGSVTLRWLGTSNGYYSESVSLYLMDE